VKPLGACPVLRVADTDAALRFYTGLLGFTEQFRFDDYASVRLGEAELHVARPADGKPAGGGTVYVYCDEVDEYFGTIRARGARPVREPADQFYGMRDFQIHDPDGNQLSFGCSASPKDCAQD
jgi:uncharacterized glyoxalase superfamily protein PhnB